MQAAQHASLNKHVCVQPGARSMCGCRSARWWLVPARSGADCSHNTYAIIGLRGARRSTRRLPIMLIYGIYFYPNRRSHIVGLCLAQSETKERRDVTARQRQSGLLCFTPRDVLTSNRRSLLCGESYHGDRDAHSNSSIYNRSFITTLNQVCKHGMIP